MPDTDVDTMPDTGSDADTDEQESSTRPFWSGTISFGLVSIPVNLFPAARSSHVGLRMLGPQGRPLQRRYFAEQEDAVPGKRKGAKRSKTATREADANEAHDEPSDARDHAGAETDEPLTADRMVKGYEISKGNFVIITNEELERLAPDKSRDIDLREFVKRDEIAPMYFDRPYFLAPAGPSAKAYQLLAAVMERTGRAGIATFVMRGKEYLVGIFADNGILTAETLRFADEVRSPEDVGLPKAESPSASIVKQFQKVIAKQSADKLDRDELRDVRDAELIKLVDKKLAKKQDIIEAPEAEGETQPGAPGHVIDLFAELKRSLAQKHGGGESSSAARSRPAHKHRATEKKKPRRAHSGTTKHGKTA